ncbi:dihydrolipoamide acetyltransferase family protein [Marinomonas epiphytica]
MNNVMEILLPEGTLEGTAATLSTWLVAEGEKVQKDAPLLELETDKVTMEVCAETDGVVGKLLAQSGDNVNAETVFGYLDCGAQTSVLGAASTSKTLSADPELEPFNEQAKAVQESRSKRELVGPAVRRLLREHHLDITLIPGTGKGGRVTRNDVLTHLDTSQPLNESNLISKNIDVCTKASDGLRSKQVPHTAMRKKIASHMVESLLHTSPHVTSVFEMDMSRIIEHRNMCKIGFEEAGAKLTFTAYFLVASAKAMKEVPDINSRFYDDHLEIFEDVNIGIGTALGNDGVIVPVVKQVQEMSLFNVASALQSQTEKARQGKLTAADMKDGTFTISNHGVSGSLFATPIIINQPQVAILGIGKLEKRAVVEEVNGEDTVVIRPKCYVSLSIDHRALDAYQTNLFLSHFVHAIEHWGE